MSSAALTYGINRVMAELRGVVRLDKKLSLPELTKARDEFVREADTANRLAQADEADRWAAAFDAGDPRLSTLTQDTPEKSPARAAFMARWNARRGELGIPEGANILEALNIQIHERTAELRAIYAREGEPKEAQALRKRLSEATAAAWAAERAYRETQKAYRDAGGVLGCANEDAQPVAAAKASAAAAKAEALRRELRDRFGLER